MSEDWKGNILVGDGKESIGWVDRFSAIEDALNAHSLLIDKIFIMIDESVYPYKKQIEKMQEKLDSLSSIVELLTDKLKHVETIK